MTDSIRTLIQGVSGVNPPEDLVIMNDEGGLHPTFLFPGSSCQTSFEMEREGEEATVSEVCTGGKDTQRVCTFFMLGGVWFFSTGWKYGDDLYQDGKEEGCVCDAGAVALTALVRSLSLGFVEEE